MAYRYQNIIYVIVVILCSGCMANEPVLSDSKPRYDLQQSGELRTDTLNLRKPLELGVVTYKPEQLISTDMINALTQLNPYSRLDTVFKVPDEPDEFMTELEQRLLERGYTVERVGAKTGSGVLMSTVVRAVNTDMVFTYMVAIDRIAIKRDYRLGADRVLAPVSSLYLRGASPSSIALNDAIFLDVQL